MLLREAPLLVLLSGCEVGFPIHESKDAADADLGDARVEMDATLDVEGSANDAASEPIEDSSATDSTPGAVWCGANDGGDAGLLCSGTCCVKIGNGYSFACRALGDPCLGYNIALSCDRTTSCPNSQYCCYTEMGSLEAGTYAAEAGCGSCSPFEAMCRLGTTDDCPGNLGCQAWFSAYGVCR